MCRVNVFVCHANAPVCHVNTFMRHVNVCVCHASVFLGRANLSVCLANSSMCYVNVFMCHVNVWFWSFKWSHAFTWHTFCSHDIRVMRSHDTVCCVNAWHFDSLISFTWHNPMERLLLMCHEWPANFMVSHANGHASSVHRTSCLFCPVNARSQDIDLWTCNLIKFVPCELKSWASDSFLVECIKNNHCRIPYLAIFVSLQTRVLWTKPFAKHRRVNAKQLTWQNAQKLWRKIWYKYDLK